MKFRKKPIEVEAVRYVGTAKSRDQIYAWSAGEVDVSTDEQQKMSIRTLEGVMTVDVGDWIVRGVKGEYYPCKPDIFEATYDPA